MIKLFRSILLIGLIFAFSSIMTLAQVEGGELVDGEEIEVEVDGEEEVIFTYEGTEGDVITITVVSEDDTDTRLYLYDEDGDEVTNDDDSGPGTNPAIIRQVLPADGEYTILLRHYSEGEELDDEFEVTLYEVELLDATNEAITVVLGDDFEVDRIVFEAEEDVQYTVLFFAEDDYSSTLYVDLMEEDDMYASIRFDMAGTTTAGFIFEASDDGIVELELTYYGFSDEIEVTVEVSVRED